MLLSVDVHRAVAATACFIIAIPQPKVTFCPIRDGDNERTHRTQNFLSNCARGFDLLNEYVRVIISVIIMILSIFLFALGICPRWSGTRGSRRWTSKIRKESGGGHFFEELVPILLLPRRQ